LRKNIQSEEEVGGNIGAGLDWGDSFEQLLLNPELFYRLKTLRIFLNREVRLLIKDWNLGTYKNYTEKFYIILSRKVFIRKKSV
jgi:hypothetical protein